MNTEDYLKMATEREADLLQQEQKQNEDDFEKGQEEFNEYYSF